MTGWYSFAIIQSCQFRLYQFWLEEKPVFGEHLIPTGPVNVQYVADFAS